MLYCEPHTSEDNFIKMDILDLQPLFDNYHRKINRIDLRFKRYLYNQINWEARMICIKGARGVGKTTMLLQNILENYEDIDQTLYASLDDLWFAEHSLIELVDWSYRHGLRRLYLDEVHRYPLWSQTLKNIYDSFPEMRIVYTGSALLIIDNAKTDLSRRQTSYTLYGLSFREFLELENVMTHEPIKLDFLLVNHLKKAMEITKEIPVAKWFEEYLHHGYYPFYHENLPDFLPRLRETVNIVIENDLPLTERMTQETTYKLKKLLMIISRNVPFQPKMSDLWSQISTSNESGLKMLYALNRAQILAILSSETKNYKHLSKPDKIFLGDTNLMFALCNRIDKGNERETFFFSQLKVNHEITYPLSGDFLIDNHWLFEVGGKNKKFDQIADIPNSYLAIDDTEIGYGNRIPLWLFGFLY